MLDPDSHPQVGRQIGLDRGIDEGGVLSISYRTLDDLDLLCDVLSKIPRDMLPDRMF